ncbi:MAG: tRNA uridine-5-carboxymethylaminomethyl(34) synthesis GTPase MnmE [Bacteroidales bacterium]|nr:tRNA uridine-5-carboxymethylaminomethyl(34) synthesis GTPase MnmE [Bacteroidales bacterium]
MPTIFEDTIIASATIPGTGAISLLRISGPRAFELTDSLVVFRKGNASEAKPNTIKFGTILKDGTLLDEVLVCIYKAPHSYTGEDSVEIMCHASSYIVTEILAMALGLGARLAEHGEYTKRAFLNGKMDLTQAESVADMVASTTAASHRVAANQLKGGFSAELKVLREKLLEMASLLELELDFSEEDVEFADRQRLDALLDTVMAKVSSLASSFKLGNAIKNGIPVAIVGATNAGKSTLLNAILGEQRAIVSDIEGTTRDTIEETFNVNGVLFRFVDTAGIRETTGEIERIGIERSFSSIRKSDVVIILLDAVTLSNTLSSSGAFPDESLTQILSAADFTAQKVIFALNKVDIVGNLVDNIFVNIKNTIVSYISKKSVATSNKCDGVRFVEISAKELTGMTKLLDTLSELVEKDINAVSESSVLVTNMRHYEALVTAHKSLLAVKDGLASGSPTDLVAEDLRAALSTLGSITGEITTTDILQNIFSKFCIGK